MECKNIRKEFPKIEFEPCCESCHEDESMGYGNDLWFEDSNGKKRHMCCAMHRGFKKKNGEINHDC